VAYFVAAVPSNSQVQLSAPYAGASSVGDEALAVFHSTRTPQLGLPSLERRDRQFQQLWNVAMGILDEVISDHEARIAALE